MYHTSNFTLYYDNTHHYPYVLRPNEWRQFYRYQLYRVHLYVSSLAPQEDTDYSSPSVCFSAESFCSLRS